MSTILYITPSYSLDIKSAKERPRFIQEMAEEILGARLSEKDLIYFKDELSAIKYGEDYKGDQAVIRFLEITKELMRKKAKESVRLGDWDIASILARQSRLFHLAIVSAQPPSHSIFQSIGFWLLTFLGSCNSCEEKGIPQTVVVKDQQGEPDSAVFWELNSVKYLYFSRSNTLFVIENGQRRIPTLLEKKAFYNAKDKSDDLSFKGFGSRLAGYNPLNIPEFATLSDATHFIRRHYHNVQVIKEIKKLSDIHYGLAIEYFNEVRLIKSWREFKTGFLYSLTYHEGLRMRYNAKLPPIEGARLAVHKQVLDVVDLGTRDGSFMPRIREWLIKHGFENVEIVGIDNGDWMDEEGYSRSNETQKKALVELADKVLKGHNPDYSYQILFGDIFKHFPKSFIHQFDIVFINAPPQNMSVSWVHRALRLIRENGVIILRYGRDQHVFMNVASLMDFAKAENLSVRISKSDIPEGEEPLSDVTYFIKHGNFTWQAHELTAIQLIKRQFEIGKPEEQAS